MKKIIFLLAAFLLFALSSHAAVIDFTGGTAYLNGGSQGITNGVNYYSNVDYYVESGFKLDFIGADGYVAPYYGGDNDVIHGHWGTGDYGQLLEIRITQVNGDPFDLNYFILTSNTDFGGGSASGNEQAYINASWDGTTIGFSQLLPSDDWGFVGSNPQIFLGSEFDSVYWFSFTVGNAVDCFGMDNFYINEPAPTVPEPSTLLLLAGGFLGLSSWMRRGRVR